MARCHSSFELQPLSRWCQLLRIIRHVKRFIWSCVTCRCTKIWNWTIQSMRKDTLPHSARLSPISIWRHDSAQWRESQGERGEWSWWPIKVKVKVKAICGSYSTAALRHIVLLPEWVPSFIPRGAAHTKQRDRPLLAKEGTILGI